MPSLRSSEGFERSWRFAAEYLRICEHPRRQSQGGQRTLLSGKHLYKVSGYSRNSRPHRTHTHDHAADNVWPETSGEGSHTLLSTDSYDRVEDMVVPESLSRRFRSVGTHSDQSNLYRKSAKTHQVTAHTDLGR